METKVKTHELRIMRKMKIMRDKVKKASGKATMGDLLPIVLRRNEDEEANKIIGNQEPLDPVKQVLTGVFGPQRKPGAGSGEKKKDGHEPLAQETDKSLKTKRFLRVFKVPVHKIKEPGVVEEKDDQHRDDPEPIDVVATLFQYLTPCLLRRRVQFLADSMGGRTSPFC